jgi:hypothetical protein
MHEQRTSVGTGESSARASRVVTPVSRALLTRTRESKLREGGDNAMSAERITHAPEENITVSTNQNQSKDNAAAMDAWHALQANRGKGKAGRKAVGSTAASKANRKAKTLGVMTAAHKDGMTVLQADTVLKGWTQSENGRLVESVTPESVRLSIVRMAEQAVERASIGIEHVSEAIGIYAIPSESLTPQGSTFKHGGRFYIVSLPNVDVIDDVAYAAMIDDISDEDAGVLTGLRPLTDVVAEKAEQEKAASK